MAVVFAFFVALIAVIMFFINLIKGDSSGMLGSLITIIIVILTLRVAAIKPKDDSEDQSEEK
jgi:hypothetical protein